MAEPLHWWIIFNVFVLVMLALDLGVFHRHAHTVRLKEAIGWSVFWVVLALLFNLGLWWLWPTAGSKLTPNQAGLAFFTGYVIERALSIDNIFVFVVLFSYFRLDSRYHHKVLFWGILGAMVMRAIFIFAGVALIKKFEWTLYIFGGFLILTGVKMALSKGVEVHPERNPILKLLRKVLPLTKDYVNGAFFARVDGRRLATPMFVVLIMVEFTDLVFAIDSIPAIFGITDDAFIIYTSNVFAILGLRALYFALAGVMDLFEYLHYGLAAVLIFVGVKMLLDVHWHKDIGIGWSLGVVAFLLGAATIASLLQARKAPL
jgi:tellurite resistance protein TerC